MNNRSKLVSIDFWNTLVDPPTGGEGRKKIRYNSVQQVADSYGYDLTVDAFDQALKGLSDHFNHIWREEQRTPEADEIIRELMRRLGMKAGEKQIRTMADVFIHSLLESPPDLMPGVTEWIPKLASHFTLAIISDTMVTPGQILRKFLDQKGILQYFNTLVFSDEVGFSKPHPDAFKKVLKATGCEAHQAWHIGDMQRTDISGAQSVGMKAMLYAANLDDDAINGNTADCVVYSWHEAGTYLLDGVE